MTTEIEITDLRSLQEKRERLKLQVKYHRLGVEMYLRSGLSIPSLFGLAKDKLTGAKDDEQESGPLSGLSFTGSLGIWGLVVPLLVKIISIKTTTDRSWGEIAAHIFRSVIRKLTS